MSAYDWTCDRCGHSSDWHRFDDYQLGHNGVTSHLDPGAKFRCVGPDLAGCDQDCPDMTPPRPPSQAAAVAA